MNIPSFRAIKCAFGGSRLTLMVHPYCKDLAGCIEEADEIMTWESKRHGFLRIFKLVGELKKKDFDLVVIFNPSKEMNIISFLAAIPKRIGYDRKWGFLLTHKMEDKKHLGQLHEIEYNLQLAALAGAKTEDKTLSLRIDDGIIDILLDGFGLRKNHDLVALHPWTSDSFKQWPAENFVRLAKRLEKELNKTVLIIGGPEELEKSRTVFNPWILRSINLTGKISLIQLATLLKRCRLLISCDSGPVHLASCVGTPALALFRTDVPGKSSVRWGPVSRGSAVIEKTSLFDITVEEVFDKTKRMLER
ncbi:MAG: glycosyltransferase family 9 protein [Candidatus Omnitrophota bacterium]